MTISTSLCSDNRDLIGIQDEEMLTDESHLLQTILLRDKKQQDYCIGCNEVDVAPTGKYMWT